jgi:hypothetical protein
VEVLFINGAKEVTMGNGMKKRVYEDGVIIIQLTNGDIKMVIKTINM